MIITKSIIENGIYGLAIGDALGIPYEFISREKIAESPCETMVAGGTHGKPVGTWSDDTSLTLATLDGLAEMDDYGTIMSKFDAWLNNSEYSVEEAFGVGRTTLFSIAKYRKGIDPIACGGRAATDNGNGSLMRILPAVLYSLAKYNKVNYEFIDNISSLTHGHAISRIACRIYADIVQSILQNAKKGEFLSTVDLHGQEEFSRLKSAEFHLLPENEIKSSGYVVDTLEAALWCFYGTENYKDCVLKAVNLGRDTDTVAAVAGSLAGLYYGKQSIPFEWLELLRGKQMIDELIEKFCNRMNSF
ncbi:MAG: ADP-ribosylglycohydrolase family protein [Clostridiales bacterium]|nr:ADP-ribosylglycohydrolase family protein [Clostridiales bacterium]